MTTTEKVQSKTTSMLVKSTKNFHYWQRRALQEFGERNGRPQEQIPDFYRYVRKLNYGLLDSDLVKPSSEDLQKLNSFVPSPKMLAVNPLALKLYPAGCNLHIVESEHTFDIMTSDLASCVEIALDLECHQRYSFRGMIALMQISSPTADYIICPFATRAQILEKLSMVLSDSNIAKVFHAIDNDYLAIRRDFNITIIGAVDTKEAYKLVTGTKESIGFDALMQEVGLTTELKDIPEKKMAQLADWRIRPLPRSLVTYARHDSHAVLRIWNQLKLKLEEKNIPVSEAFKATSALLSVLKYKPPKQEDPLTGLKSIKFVDGANTHESKLKFIDLHRWRLHVAKMVDCSPMIILTNRHLVEIIHRNPQSVEDMQKELDARTPAFLRGKQGKAFFLVFSVGFRNENFNNKCHNCFLLSHQAWACWKKKDREAWKKYMNDPKNLEFKHKQFARRMRKLKEKKRPQ